jgi:hypothetical protein
MKYAGPYYKSLRTFAKTRCNLNYLCWDIEKWQKMLNWEYEITDTSELMMDMDIGWDFIKYDKIHQLFQEFQKESAEAKKQQAMLLNWEDYANTFFKGYTKSEVFNTRVDWQLIYNHYRELAQQIVPNQSELANYAVQIVYNRYPNKSKNFAWVIAEDGILRNLEKNKEDNIKLPIESTEDNESSVEYLGKYYILGELFNNVQ